MVPPRSLSKEMAVSVLRADWQEIPDAVLVVEIFFFLGFLTQQQVFSWHFSSGPHSRKHSLSVDISFSNNFDDYFDFIRNRCNLDHEGINK